MKASQGLARFKLFAPLSVRDYRLLWAGQSVSYIGNGVTTVALAWQTLALSPKATTLSLVLMARTVPLLILLLVGGAVTDRMPRRVIMLASDATRAVVVGAIAILAATGQIRLWHVFLLAAVFGSAEAFFFPSFTAILPDILRADQILPANALESAVRPLTIRMIGPALGGAIVAGAGTAAAFGIDAATFAFSAACLLAMTRLPQNPRSRDTTILADIREGLRYVRSEAWIWATLLMATLAVLAIVGPLDVLLPIYSRQVLRSGARGYGLLLAVMGLGGILGALITSRVGLGRRRVRNMFIAFGLAVLPFSILALTRSLAVAMLAMGALGFGLEVGNIAWTTLMQELVPGRLMGRVRSLDYLLSFALMPLSYGIAGPLAAGLGILPVIGVSGLLASAVTLAFMLYPGVLGPDAASYRPPAGSKAAEHI